MIGIIANPSSGKDIRRLIANATCFDNMEKVNIIQRIMVVFNRMSDAQILFMDDAYGMMYKAQENIRIQNADESMEAAQERLEALFMQIREEREGK